MTRAWPAGAGLAARLALAAFASPSCCALSPGLGGVGRRGSQSGAVLIVGLVVLLVITLVGISGLRTSAIQERMAGNLHQNSRALQSAEAALQAGLAYVEEQSSPPVPDGSGSHPIWRGCRVRRANQAADSCRPLDEVLSNWQGELSAVDAGVSYEAIASELGDAGRLPGVVAQPRLFIEERYFPPLDVEQAAQGAGIYYYTVTAVGFGGSESARVIVQSTVAKVFRL